MIRAMLAASIVVGAFTWLPAVGAAVVTALALTWGAKALSEWGLW